MRRRQILPRPQRQSLARSRQPLVRIGVPRERGSERLGRRGRIPNAIRRGRACLRQFVPQRAHLCVFGRLPAPDLLFQRANARNLAHIGRHAPEEQIARYVESARRDVAAIALGLHLLRPRIAIAKIREGQLVDLGVCRQERLASLAICRRVGAGQLGRSDEAGARKILIARRFGLPIPQRLILDLGGRQFRNALEAQSRYAPGRRSRRGRIGNRSSPETSANRECAPNRWRRGSNRETGCSAPGHTPIFRAAWAPP